MTVFVTITAAWLAAPAVQELQDGHDLLWYAPEELDPPCSS